jgi:hypothetical protein
MRAILLLLLFCAWHACAAATQPARLTEGPDSIESHLRIPEGLLPGRYVVQCEAWLRRNGKVRTFLCYSAEKTHGPLVAAVARAGRQARFVAAMRDGKPAEVSMQVMVRIDITSQGPLVLAVPNNGVEAERYGLLYTAPQRFNEFIWHGNHDPLKSSDILLWRKLRIDEQGKVIEYRLENVGNVPQWFVDGLAEQVERMEFMPGYYEGKPVPMAYIEPWLE